MSKDLGKSTSYAYYVAEGGTKTPQEYGEMLVNIDTVATRAEDAADSAAESATGALNSKNAAQTAATTATNKASEATTAATTATTKAGEASTSASTATSAKDTAVSASQTATSKATEATTAAATATSAKTDAVAANTAAQSAKTAAQTAQTGAETAAASVQSSAAQIQTNADDISELKEELNNITNESQIIGIPDESDCLDNKYVDKWSTLQSLSGFRVIKNISIEKGETIKVYCKATNYVSVIAKDNGETYTALINATDSTFKLYAYTASENENLAVSYDTALNHSILIIKENIAEIKKEASESYTAMPNAYESITGTNYTGKQAQKSGSTVVLSGGSDSYKVFEANVDEFEHLRIDCYAGSNTTYSVGFFFCDENNNIIYQYNNATNGRYQIETIAPAGSKKIYVNAYGFVPYAKDIYKTCPPIKYSSLALFEHFGVIGDSFASGELYYNGDYHDKYNISWGQILARKLGTTCTNYSRGGLTTRSWLTATKGLPLVLSNPAEDIYYCALGINDVYSLGIDYLGTLADITDFDSYTDYRDTFYGNYGRIIEQVQNHATNAKIVMFTMASTSGNYPAFNNAIIEIANHYNIPYIIQGDDPFFNTDIYLRMEGSHPTAIGYSGMAEAFERLLNKCIDANLTYFRDAFMY